MADTGGIWDRRGRHGGRVLINQLVDRGWSVGGDVRRGRGRVEGLHFSCHCVVYY